MNGKRLRLLLVAVVSILCLIGCENEASKKYTDTSLNVYYLSESKDQIVGKDYQPQAVSTKELVAEYLKQLSTVPSGEEMQSAISSKMKVSNFSVEGNQLYLHFSEYKVTGPEEVLRRAAIVRTLVQVPTIECITFYVGESPLQNSLGQYVGVMTKDTFIENVGEQVNNVSEQNIVLYYATLDGKRLIAEQKKVVAVNNISSEKLIIQHLMEGNSKKGLRSAIPPSANLLSVSTLDGICFVNFDSGFAEQDYSIEEDVVIYSIVNSLCELTNVNKVQISINGDTSRVYRDDFSLEELYERNLDLVRTE